jgi:acetyl-CoA carboxylase biotin carboxyl carrier protein
VSEYPEVDTIGRLLELAGRYGLEELEVSEGALEVTLRAPVPPRASREADGEAPTEYLWQPPVWQPHPEPVRPPGAAPQGHPVAAPLTGIFYRSASPDAPAFVEAGDTVEEGQPIGMIEAMKVFSEVTADRGGVVLEIAAKNGRLVQHGDPLLFLDPR